LDDRLAEAHTALGSINHLFKHDWAAAEREYLRGIELNPNYPRAHQTYGNYLEYQGRFDEGLAEHRQAQVLDPLSPRINLDLGGALLKHGQYDLAIEQYEKTLELQPDFRQAHGGLGRAFLRKGQYEDALASFEKAEDLYGVAYLYAVTGRESQALEVLEEAQAADASSSLSNTAMVYAALGEFDQAFDWLNEVLEWPEFEDFWGGWSSFEFDPIRDDPRFHDLMRRMNLEP